MSTCNWINEVAPSTLTFELWLVKVASHALRLSSGHGDYLCDPPLRGCIGVGGGIEKVFQMASYVLTSDQKGGQLCSIRLKQWTHHGLHRYVHNPYCPAPTTIETLFFDRVLKAVRLQEYALCGMHKVKEKVAMLNRRILCVKRRIEERLMSGGEKGWVGGLVFEIDTLERLNTMNEKVQPVVFRVDFFL